jgi:hypothetical protein
VTLSEVGRRGQSVDVLNGGDVTADGRLLSVAEIQQAFRTLKARQDANPAHAHRAARAAVESDAGEEAAPDPGPGVPQSQPTPGPAAADVGYPQVGDVDLDGRWVGVIAAHAGAGASTVALAIADAAAAAGRATHLIETAHPARSGLVATSSAELGTDPTGVWRRGVRRGTTDITIDRRAGEDAPEDWPTLAAHDSGLVVVDLGLPQALNRLHASGARVVLVCRPTVPGVRLVEQVLATLGDGLVALAAVGPSRWPGEVTASQGQRLRALRAADALVTVPRDRHLEVTGATNSPLPKSVTAAGRALLGLIDAAHPGDATTSAHSAPRRKGTTR